MTTQKQTDNDIHDRVLEELCWDLLLNEAGDIGVAVNHGVVTLSGTVNNYPARLAAQDAAHRVRGVLDVANEIAVKLRSSSERTDAEIAHSVRAVLEWDVHVPHERITTTVSHGTVTLEGKVDNWKQHQSITRAIHSLRGVCEINDFVSVVPVSHPKIQPEEIRLAIERALERHAEHSASHVKIHVDDEKIVLSGQIATWAEREAVVGAARGTRGDGEVQNHIIVGR